MSPSWWRRASRFVAASPTAWAFAFVWLRFTQSFLQKTAGENVQLRNVRNHIYLLDMAVGGTEAIRTGRGLTGSSVTPTEF